MRILPAIASAAIGAAALIATPALAAKAAKAPAATAAAKPATGAQQAPTEVQHAVLFLRVIISGLQSDKVEQPVKSALVGCLYDNSLGKITESTDKLIAENPGKVNLESPSDVLSAIVAVCGYRPEGAAAGAGAPGASATPTAQPTKPAAGR